MTSLARSWLFMMDPGLGNAYKMTPGVGSCTTHKKKKKQFAHAFFNYD
jgi:hypothetical protein